MDLCLPLARRLHPLPLPMAPRVPSPYGSRKVLKDPLRAAQSQVSFEFGQNQKLEEGELRGIVRAKFGGHGSSRGGEGELVIRITNLACHLEYLVQSTEEGFGEEAALHIGAGQFHDVYGLLGSATFL